MSEELNRASPRLRQKRWVLAGAIAGIALVVSMIAILVIPHNKPLPQFKGLGYDLSFPQCKIFEAGQTINLANHPPTFLVVGLGNGRPFTTNRCLATQWKWATKTWPRASHSIYFNTGYAAPYLKLITPYCRSNLESSLDFTKAGSTATAQNAWLIGCSEADFALSVAHRLTPGTLFLWADVEIENSWSMNTALNLYVVDGLSWRMNSGANSPGGGFYSPGLNWETLIGAQSAPTPNGPRWASGATPRTGIPTACSNDVSGKAFAATLINQGAIVNGIDTNWGCSR